MPMENDDVRGTNSDESPNDDYCKFCFQKGKFADPNLTLDKQIKKMVGFAGKMKMSPEQAKVMASAVLPSLKRWRKARQ